jgi:PKD repeat protein
MTVVTSEGSAANNTCETREDLNTDGTTPTQVEGGLAPVGFGGSPDVDYFLFRGPAGQEVVADLEGAATGAGTLGSPRLGLVGVASCGIIDADDGGIGFNSQLMFPVPDSGEFILAVSRSGDIDFDGMGGSPSTGTYVLRVSWMSNGISQEFFMPKGKPVLELDFAFVNTEALEDAEEQPDKVQVFVSLVEADGSSGISGANTGDPYEGFSLVVTEEDERFGRDGRVTPVKVGAINLEEVFPGSDDFTRFKLDVRVGNGGDSSNSPYTEVDHVRFSAPSDGELSADFSWTFLDGMDPTSSGLLPFPGDVVSFTDDSTGEPTSWLWNFGIDGNTFGDGACDPVDDNRTGSAERNPRQCFPLQGMYDVNLSVRRGDLPRSNVTVPVSIGTPPQASFTVDPLPLFGTAPLTVRFINTSDLGSGSGGITEASWVFECPDAIPVCSKPDNDLILANDGEDYDTSFEFSRGDYEFTVRLEITTDRGDTWSTDAKTYRIKAQQGFGDVWAGINGASCADCHGMVDPAPVNDAFGLSLVNREDSYSYLTNLDNMGHDGDCKELPLVQTYPYPNSMDPDLFPTGNPLDSVFWNELDPLTDGCGTRPHDRGSLPGFNLQILFDWINDGAAR